MIKNSVKISRLTKFGELSIGFIVISMITTIPELMISLMAIKNNNIELSVGSLFGSLITNICLILGLIAVRKPLELSGHPLKKLLWILPIIVLIISTFFIFPSPSRLFGVILFLFFWVFIYYVIKEKIGIHVLKNKDKDYKNSHKPIKIYKSLFLLILGFFGILLSSNFTIESASNIAKAFGISEFVIGSTIIALGASIPELATTWEATKEGHKNLAIGNVIGESYIYVTLILGLVIMISPLKIEMAPFSELIFFVFLSTIFFWAFLGSWGRRRIDRLEGIILLILYFIFILRSFHAF